jgi:hypothetical protein
VRSVSSCTAASTVTKTKTVSVTDAYYVFTDDNKLVTVTATNNAASGVSGTITYTLYNQATGATLDFSQMPDGIYILALDSGNGKPDTHRIVLK